MGTLCLHPYSPPGFDCMKDTRAWFLVLREMKREVLSAYMGYRRSGDCPCKAMWCAMYDWDV